MVLGHIAARGSWYELYTVQPLILSLGLVVAIVKLCYTPNQRVISLHPGALRKSVLILVLLLVPICPNYGPYSLLQLGTSKTSAGFVHGRNCSGDHTFDFKNQDRPMSCPKYLCLNQDSVAIFVLLLVFGGGGVWGFFFFLHFPPVPKPDCVIYELQFSSRDNSERTNTLPLIYL